MLPLDGQTIDGFLHGIVLFELGLDLLVLAYLESLLLALFGQVLPEYGLVPLVPLLLLLRVEQVPLRVHIEYVVLVQLLPRTLLNLVHLTLRLLLQLVVQRHKQVALPNAKLGLQGVVLAHGREERIV